MTALELDQTTDVPGHHKVRVEPRAHPRRIPRALAPRPDANHSAERRGLWRPCTTASVNLVGGGSAGNIAADRCRAQFEFRSFASVDPNKVRAPIQTF